MTRTLTITYRFAHMYREKIFAILVAAILLTACSYIFLLQKTIVNVVQRQKISLEGKEVSAKVADLEEKYFFTKNTITLDLARTKGFSSAEDIAYISKKPQTAMAAHHEF